MEASQIARNEVLMQLIDLRCRRGGLEDKLSQEPTCGQWLWLATAALILLFLHFSMGSEVSPGPRRRRVQHTAYFYIFGDCPDVLEQRRSVSGPMTRPTPRHSDRKMIFKAGYNQ